MGTWISHLRIAEELLPTLPDVEEAAFVYGSLAPDSGLPNEDWTIFDPPKEVTHFLHTGEEESSIRDGVFYQQYLAPLNSSSDSFLYSFRLGYFIHLLCDNIWAKKIWATTARAFESEIRADQGKAFGNIKFDWYGLDQVYVKSHPGCIFWRVFAASPNPPSGLPFIPDAAFHHQMDYILHFYSHPEDLWFTPRKYPYLNEQTMTRFVKNSVEIITDTLNHHLPFGGTPVPDSLLTLVAEDSVCPYEPPLGDV